MRQYNYPFLILICMVAALGGLLFGYDWVVIGGAKPFYELYFNIQQDSGLQGWAMSSALVGCVFGAVFAGTGSDKFGRKILLMMAAALFSISAFGTGYANTFTVFIIYRIIGGVGIGMASTLSPMYISEISPSKLRGFFVSINQLTIVLGILAAQIANMLIKRPIPDDILPNELLRSWNGQMGWRWMFWAELIPAVLFLILIFFIPESPRFLAKKEKTKEARSILERIGGPVYANSIIQDITNSVKAKDQQPAVWKSLSKKDYSIIRVGIVLAVFQQWCGINIIFNYAQEIFVSAGYSINDMFMNIVVTGGINVLFTILAMSLVDRWGRKRLMLLGSGSLAVIYLILGLFYYINLTGLPMLLLVLLGIATYAMTLAPVIWVIISEIFPNRYRGLAMAISTFALWVSSALLVQTFPILNEVLGTYGTFWLYGFICICGYFYVKTKLPETKNKTLEEIEKELFTDNA